MHDLVIRDGTIVDGSGAKAMRGDIAIDGAVITQVGGRAGPGREEIAADGHLVAPGWVDIHSHYDGTALWDPYLKPSGSHGVTTVVMGNCGVGFAPVRRADQERLMSLMEGVEDIPVATLREGMAWDWESFPQYLDAIERAPSMLDRVAQIPHSALRTYVMGERGSDRKQAATAADMQRMAELVEEGLRAGALGFSTSRTKRHHGADGRHVPGSFAEHAELMAIGAAMRSAGHGVFQMVADFSDPGMDFEWMATLSKQFKVPVHYILMQFPEEPRKYRDLLARTAAEVAAGADISALVACRSFGMIYSLESEIHPFWSHPSYAPIAKLGRIDRVRALRDPQLRKRLLSESPTSSDPFWREYMQKFDGMFRLGDPPEYEPPADASVAAIASRRGCKPEEVVYDMLLEQDGREMIYFPFFNYVDRDMNPLLEMMRDPHSLLSLADGGAHCAITCDASMPTYLLTHWVRDRSRGPKLSLEEAVHLQTGRTAAAYGLHDRGRLAPGFKADLNVIDLERLRLSPTQWAQDLPANGRRLLQFAEGYIATVASGEITLRDDRPTGALPGKLVRGPRRRP